MGRRLKGKSGKGAGSLRLQLISHQKSSVGQSKKKKEEVVVVPKPKKTVVHTFIPFTIDDNLMLVGEGDFSFAKSIVEAKMILPSNLIATSYDSREDLQRKYPDTIEGTLLYLEEQHVVLQHGIDGRDLVKSLKLSERDGKKNAKVLNHLEISNIMFNFPHIGAGMKDVDRNIKLHQELMVQFFESCTRFYQLLRKIRSNSYFDKVQKIIVTLFEGEPYESWGVKKIARNFNYKVERSGNFNWSSFPGYHHRRTNGTLRDTSTPAVQRKARIYVFEPIQEKEEDANTKKHNSDDDDDDD